MKKLRLTLAGLVVAVMLAFAASASAQIAPLYYWGCQYWLFGWGPFGYTTITTNTPYISGDSYDNATQTGWKCEYVAVCYYTQDIFGNVQEYCS